MIFWETLAIAVIPAGITGLATYLRLRHEIQLYKTESMAERAARHFLKHKKFTDRSFGTIKKHLGGWDDDEDELRKILVRAGAIRVMRDDQEWWTLLSREKERIEKFRKKAGRG